MAVVSQSTFIGLTSVVLVVGFTLSLLAISLLKEMEAKRSKTAAKASAAA